MDGPDFNVSTSCTLTFKSYVDTYSVWFREVKSFSLSLPSLNLVPFVPVVEDVH